MQRSYQIELVMRASKRTPRDEISWAAYGFWVNEISALVCSHTDANEMNMNTPNTFDAFIFIRAI